MKVLQIANDYFGTKLYQRLFDALEVKKISSLVVVPVAYHAKIHPSTQDDVLQLPCYSNLDRILYFPKQKALSSAIEKRVEQNTYDIVHAHTVFSAGYAACQLKKRHGIPYIVAVRNTDVNVFFKKMPHLRPVGVRILRQAEKIVFLSPAYRETVFDQYVPKKYHEELRAKSVVIPNGIDPLFFENKGTARKLQKESLNLIYVGEISSNKNLELTVEAVKKLRAEGMNATLRVVGEIREESYRKLMEETPFISYYARCPLQQVLEHLRQSDIFVMPSHTETFGLVYAEAMSQGLPVLYTRGQGFDGQFSEGAVGYAVSDTDAEEIVERVKAVIEDYAVLSENCIQMAKRFDWDAIAKRYCEIYQGISS